MKKLLKQQITLIILITSIGFGLASCGDDDEKSPTPKADFTYTLSGETVTFTNTSTDADTYSWDFGDTETSTDANPIHDYASVGAYVVTLTATSAGGTDEKIAAIEVKIPITIDGDLSDWADVAALSTKNADNPGILSVVKATSDLSYIYFYMEGNDSFNGFIQMYLDANDDATSGFIPLDHPVSGADYELDASTAENAEFYAWTPADGIEQSEWQFDTDPINDATLVIIGDKAGNAIEFAIKREPALIGLSEVSTIRFALGDVNTSDDPDINPLGYLDEWYEHGYLPNPGEDYMELELFK